MEAGVLIEVSLLLCKWPALDSSTNSGQDSQLLETLASKQLMIPATIQRALNCLTFSALFFAVFSFAALAQVPKTNSLPKVGTIKDYPATGLMTGCGNLYFYKAEHAKSTDANYVFLSRGDGGNAWMNLYGRDVRLRQIKSRARNQKPRHYTYRYGSVRITVEIQDFAPEGTTGEGDHIYKMKITLRNGHAVRIVSAVGDADC